MTTIKHACRDCGARSEYQKNIVELIEKYLVAKKYDYAKTDDDIMLHFFNHRKAFHVYNCEFDYQLAQNVNNLILVLALYDGMSVQAVLSEILSLDNLDNNAD